MLADYQSFFEVRLAHYDDIPDILRITHEGFLKYREMSGANHVDALDETERDVKNDIDTKIVLLATQDGAPVGTLRVSINADEGTAYLSRFAVTADNRNNGIGKSMMNLVDRIMMKKGVKRLSLHTGSKITPLIRFYYGRGFYIESTDFERGYVRALLVKEYNVQENSN